MRRSPGDTALVNNYSGITQAMEIEAESETMWYCVWPPVVQPCSKFGRKLEITIYVQYFLLKETLRKGVSHIALPVSVYLIVSEVFMPSQRHQCLGSSCRYAHAKSQ